MTCQSYSVVSQCDTQDFNLLCPCISTLLFWTLQLIATKPEQNHGAGKLASYTLQLLHRPLTAQSSSVIHSVRFIPFLLYRVTLSCTQIMYFMLTNSACTLWKKALMMWFVGLFHIFTTDDSYILVTKLMFYIELWCWCLWWFYCSQLIKNIETILYLQLYLSNSVKATTKMGICALKYTATWCTAIKINKKEVHNKATVIPLQMQLNVRSIGSSYRTQTYHYFSESYHHNYLFLSHKEKLLFHYMWQVIFTTNTSDLNTGHILTSSNTTQNNVVFL